MVKHRRGCYFCRILLERIEEAQKLKDGPERKRTLRSLEDHIVAHARAIGEKR